MIASLLIVLAACDGTTVTKSGTRTAQFFPMDGQRTAVYVNEDTGITENLEVSKIEPTESIDGREVVTFEHSLSGASLTVKGAVKWASAPGEGIKIYGFRDGPDGDFTMFDTPVLVTSENDTENPGESVTTTTNGYTFTSTFIDFEDCPVQWGLDWTGCMHLKIDDGDGDDTTGPIFAGEYWLVTRYGPAWMKLTGDGQKWNLADYDWDTGG
jgi:hypothetical protein